MAIDTPARLAILGAGPIGLEAALYARFLGYDVVLYERGEVAANVWQRGSESMDKPFGDNRTTLGLAAIQAQDEKYLPPADDVVLTFQQWIDAYLLPLSQTDLLADHVRLQATVVSVEAAELTEEGPDEEEEGGETPTFFVIERNAGGASRAELFHGVLDCTSGKEIEARKCQSLPGYYRLDAAGYDQIRKVFSVIGDRETLDLYSSAARLVR